MLLARLGFSATISTVAGGPMAALPARSWAQAHTHRRSSLPPLAAVAAATKPMQRRSRLMLGSRCCDVTQCNSFHHGAKGAPQRSGKTCLSQACRALRWTGLENVANTTEMSMRCNGPVPARRRPQQVNDTQWRSPSC